jgi:hypothetical protein
MATVRWTWQAARRLHRGAPRPRHLLRPWRWHVPANQRIDEESIGVPWGTGDFNADKNPDLVVATNGFISVLFGNGDGTFRSGPAVWIGRFFEVRVADFDGDGRSDLAVLAEIASPRHTFSSRMLILLTQGDDFREPVEITELQAPADGLPCCASAGLIVADFDRDGRPDIATSTAVLLGKGDGSFHGAQGFHTSFQFQYPVAATDIDGDGHVDLVMHTGFEGEGVGAYVLFGQGDGSMSSTEYGRAGTGLCCGVIDYLYGTFFYVARSAADLDGDGRGDLVTFTKVSSTIDGTLTVLLNRTEVKPR